MKYVRQKLEKMKNRDRMIEAALDVWEAKGELAVNAQSVGEIVGCSRQNVHKVFKSMGILRHEAAKRAVETNRIGVILQMQAARHALAPKIQSGKLL